MDLLARSGPTQRAEVFLGSFFPSEKGVTGELERAGAALDAIIRTLPPELQEAVATMPHADKAEVISSRGGWVEARRPPTAHGNRPDSPGIS